MSDRPMCKCHSEPMVLSGGGVFRCAVRRRESNRRWRAKSFEQRRDAENERNRRWRADNRDKVSESNAKRVRVGEMYLGRLGFTVSEREEMLRGETE